MKNLQTMTMSSSHAFFSSPNQLLTSVLLLLISFSIMSDVSSTSSKRTSPSRNDEGRTVAATGPQQHAVGSPISSSSLSRSNPQQQPKHDQEGRQSSPSTDFPPGFEQRYRYQPAMYEAPGNAQVHHTDEGQQQRQVQEDRGKELQPINQQQQQVRFLDALFLQQVLHQTQQFLVSQGKHLSWEQLHQVQRQIGQQSELIVQQMVEHEVRKQVQKIQQNIEDPLSPKQHGQLHEEKYKQILEQFQQFQGQQYIHQVVPHVDQVHHVQQHVQQEVFQEAVQLALKMVGEEVQHRIQLIQQQKAQPKQGGQQHLLMSPQLQHHQKHQQIQRQAHQRQQQAEEIIRQKVHEQIQLVQQQRVQQFLLGQPQGQQQQQHGLMMTPEQTQQLKKQIYVHLRGLALQDIRGKQQFKRIHGKHVQRDPRKKVVDDASSGSGGGPEKEVATGQQKQQSSDEAITAVPSATAEEKTEHHFAKRLKPLHPLRVEIPERNVLHLMDSGGHQQQQQQQTSLTPPRESYMLPYYARHHGHVQLSDLPSPTDDQPPSPPLQWPVEFQTLDLMHGIEQHELGEQRGAQEQEEMQISHPTENLAEGNELAMVEDDDDDMVVINADGATNRIPQSSSPTSSSLPHQLLYHQSTPAIVTLPLMPMGRQTSAELVRPAVHGTLLTLFPTTAGTSTSASAGSAAGNPLLVDDFNEAEADHAVVANAADADAGQSLKFLNYL